MKRKISKLELYEVDYLVAKAEGLRPVAFRDTDGIQITCIHPDGLPYSPTTDPVQAYEIIDREKICIRYSKFNHDAQWMAEIEYEDRNNVYCSGKTFLEAAMRTYVVSIYGNEAKI